MGDVYSDYNQIIKGLERTAKTRGLELIVEKEAVENAARLRTAAREIRKAYVKALVDEGARSDLDEAESVIETLKQSWTKVYYVVSGTTNGQIYVIFDDQVEGADEGFLTVIYEPPGDSDPLDPTPGFEILPNGTIETEYSILASLGYLDAFDYLMNLATQ